MIRDKESGGLGIRSIFASNICLLVRWIWKFMIDTWLKIIKSIYGECGDLSVGHEKYSKGSPWGSVISRHEIVRVLYIQPVDLFLKQVRNGFRTHFWTEWWMGPRTLANQFMRLFALENVKQVMVVDKIKECWSLDGDFQLNKVCWRGWIQTHRFFTLNSYMYWSIKYIIYKLLQK